MIGDLFHRPTVTVEHGYCKFRHGQIISDLTVSLQHVDLSPARAEGIRLKPDLSKLLGIFNLEPILQHTLQQEVMLRKGVPKPVRQCNRPGFIQVLPRLLRPLHAYKGHSSRNMKVDLGNRVLPGEQGQPHPGNRKTFRIVRIQISLMGQNIAAPLF